MVFNILVAIGIGIAIGIGVIIAILVARINPTINSLTNVKNCAGHMAEVVMAIAPQQPGSIRVKRDSGTLKIRAMTHDRRTFQVGDRVVIVEVHEGEAWVTSAELDDEYKSIEN